MNWKIYNKQTLLCLTLGISLGLSAQTVTRHAGISYVGSGQYRSLRNNPINDDYYSNPFGIMTDQSNRLVFTDEQNLMMIIGSNSYNRIGSPGDPSINGGFDDGAASSGLLNSPTGLALNPETNEIFICDYGNNNIRKVSAFTTVANSQVISTYTGKALNPPGFVNGHLSQALFNGPSDIAIKNDGTIFIADKNNHAIRKIKNDTVSTFIGMNGTAGNEDGLNTMARVNLPMGLHLYHDTLLYISDFGNRRIRVVNLNTNTVQTIVNSGLLNPRKVVRVHNTLFISDEFNVKYFKKDTLRVLAGGNTPDDLDGTGSDARFYDLYHLAFQPLDSALYVIDQGVNVIKRISIDFELYEEEKEVEDTTGQMSINYPNFSKIEVFPNPVNDILNIKLPNVSLNTNIQLLTIDGVILNSTPILNSTDFKLDCKNLKNGLYILVVEDKNGVKQYFKIQKE